MFSTLVPHCLYLFAAFLVVVFLVSIVLAAARGFPDDSLPAVASRVAPKGLVMLQMPMTRWAAVVVEVDWTAATYLAGTRGWASQT